MRPLPRGWKVAVDLAPALGAGQTLGGLGVVGVGPGGVRLLDPGLPERVLVVVEDPRVDVGGETEADVRLRDLEAVPLALDEVVQVGLLEVLEQVVDVDQDPVGGVAPEVAVPGLEDVRPGASGPAGEELLLPAGLLGEVVDLRLGELLLVLGDPLLERHLVGGPAADLDQQLGRGVHGGVRRLLPRSLGSAARRPQRAPGEGSHRPQRLAPCPGPPPLLPSGPPGEPVRPRRQSVHEHASSLVGDLGPS